MGRLALRFRLFSLFFLGVGHNKLWGAIWVVDNGLHKVLCMYFALPHVLHCVPVESLEHGRRRGFAPLLLSSVVHRLVILATEEAAKLSVMLALIMALPFTTNSLASSCQLILRCTRCSLPTSAIALQHCST